MRTTALVVPAALAMLLALTACGPEAGPTESPTPEETPTSEPTPSATPTDPVAEEDRPDRISIDTTVFVIGGPDDESIEAFDYFRPAADAVAALTAAFGAEPVVTEEEGGLETAPYTSYDWGGFTLNDPEGAGHAPAYPDFWVRVTAPDVDGIPILTHVAIQVGTPMEDVIAVQDGFSDFAPHSYLSWIFAQPVDPADVGEAPGSDLWIFVAVQGPGGGGGTVQEIVAPSVNFGV